MNKETLKNIVVDQKELSELKFMTEKMITRTGLKAAAAHLRHPNILLITGMRRAGKSVFSRLLAQDKNSAFITFDDERLAGFKNADFAPLLECFQELYDDPEYIVLDEAQNIPGWELFAGRLRENFRVIVTGSNAAMLSSELATRLTGRFSTVTIFPQSFREYLEFSGVDVSNPPYSTRRKAAIYGNFTRYLSEGGLFEYRKFGPEFIRTLFNSIITRDIAVRYGVRHTAALEEFSLLAVNYFGTRLSLSKISRSINIQSPNTCREYLKYLENTYLLFTVNNFSYKVKEQLSTFKKVYVTDNGIIRALSLDFTKNLGKLLENTVAIELKRRSYLNGSSMYYWNDGTSECDFVLRKGKRITCASQVCYDLNVNSANREISGLVNACAEFRLKKGLILTMDTEKEIRERGVKISVLPVWKWLLDSTAD